MRKLQIKTLMLGIIIGGIVFGSIGVVATNYLLKAEDVEYRDNKNLQDAIDELYGMAGNQSGKDLYKVETNSTSATSSSIIINFTKIEPTLTCRAKDSTGNIVGTGIVTDNKCTITGLQSETPYTYEIIGTQGTNTGVLETGTKSTTKFGGTAQTTNLVSSTGTTYQGLLGIVYLDPTNLSNLCNASNYPSQNSTNGNKSGCLKWYVYDTVTEDGVEKYAMILDHNTTAGIAYNTTNSNENYGTDSGNIGYDLGQLTSTHGWNSILNPRLITGYEIAKIVGYSSFNLGSSWFYFDSKTQTQTKTSKGASAYAWLFNYTKGCTSYGCDISDDTTEGYWTNSPFSDNSTYMWRVHYEGYLRTGSANSSARGLRPVIEVPSSMLNIN